jgi:hypothetical protein
MAWMRSINDIRLVMGTMLGLEEDHRLPDLDEQGLATLSVYEFFGALLEMIVTALSD